MSGLSYPEWPSASEVLSELPVPQGAAGWVLFPAKGGAETCSVSAGKAE